MSERLSIRPATLCDIDELYAIEKKCFPGKTAYSFRQLYYLVTKANSSCFVELQNKRIRGFIIILFRKNSRVAGVETIDVDPDFRRKGIAQRLLRTAEREMHQKGMLYSRLEVSAANHAARLLYTKNGYRAVAVLKNYYHYDHHGSYDAIRMMKRL